MNMPEWWDSVAERRSCAFADIELSLGESLFPDKGLSDCCISARNTLRNIYNEVGKEERPYNLRKALAFRDAITHCMAEARETPEVREFLRLMCEYLSWVLEFLATPECMERQDVGGSWFVDNPAHPFNNSLRMQQCLRGFVTVRDGLVQLDSDYTGDLRERVDLAIKFCQDEMPATRSERVASDPQRPTSQMAPAERWPAVVGVLSIVFGALGSLQGVCGIGALLLVKANRSLGLSELHGNVEAQMDQSMPYPIAQAMRSVIEFGLAVVVLVGGIMLVRRRRGSCWVLMSYAVLDLLSNTYAAIVGYLVFKATMEARAESPQMQSVGPGLVAVGWVISAIWPVFLLWWFRRVKIRESMAGWG